MSHTAHEHEPDRRHERGRTQVPAPQRGSAEATAAVGPAGPSPDGVLALQRVVGNAAVARLLGGAEVDGVDVQRSAVHEVLRKSGEALDQPVREEMESRMGADFSDVRVHTDAAASRAAESVRAEAFTSGSHVVFQQGRYNPSSAAGRHTLAHELTHVLQQRSGPVAGTDTGTGLRVSDPSDRFERAAEDNARRTMSAQRSPDTGPHPTAGHAAAGHAAVQRLTEVNRVGWSTGTKWKGRISENGQYILRGGLNGKWLADEVWVREGSPAPRYCTVTGNTNTYNGAQYTEYVPNSKFLEDCLHTAEEVMHERWLEQGNLNSRVAGTNTPFGNSDAENIAAATAHAGSRMGDNHQESPGVGQAFAVVETDYQGDVPQNESRYPYHAAAVVARDGRDAITLEVSAGEEDAEERDQKGNFYIYEVSSGEQEHAPNSFHTRQGEYFTRNAITIVIEPLDQ